MVEEKKLDEGNKAEEKEEAAAKVEDDPKKEEEPEPQEIILKVDMHCEACARKVARALKGFQGVDEVKANYRVSKVVVKGKEADPVKVAERIHKKSGRKVEIISPLPKPDDQNKEENKEADPEVPPKEEKKEEPPAVITVVLKVRMHCGPCAQLLQKKIGKIKGVESVTTDILSDQVIVKGVVDPEKLVNDVYKRTGKQASIVKEEENKDDIEKKEEDEKKKNKDDEKQDDDKKKQEEDDDDTKMELKKTDYWETKYYVDYAAAYPPPDLMFSDENPNACYVM